MDNGDLFKMDSRGQFQMDGRGQRGLDFPNIHTKIEELAENNRPPFNGERFLTDKDLSDLLKISRRCLQDYRDQGRIPYIQLGGKILYKVSDIEKLLEDNYHESLI